MARTCPKAGPCQGVFGVRPRICGQGGLLAVIRLGSALGMASDEALQILFGGLMHKCVQQQLRLPGISLCMPFCMYPARRRSLGC